MYKNQFYLTIYKLSILQTPAQGPQFCCSPSSHSRSSTRRKEDGELGPCGKNESTTPERSVLVSSSPSPIGGDSPQLDEGRPQGVDAAPQLRHRPRLGTNAPSEPKSC